MANERTYVGGNLPAHVPVGQKPNGDFVPAQMDANGALKIAGTFSASPPVGGATEAKQDATITKLGGGLPAALTAGGNLKVAILEGSSSGGGDASAANQTAQIAQIGEVQASPTANTVLDRLKTIAGKIPGLGNATAANSLPVTLSSDGPFATNFGATTDVAATTDTGTFSHLALLKRLVSKIPAVGATTASASLPVTIASDQASVPVVGAVVTVSTEFTRPADTTAYTAGDVVSNATSGNALITLASVVRANGGTGYITGIRLSTNKKSITPRFRVHFFNASDPTFSADNAAHKELYADGAKRLGYYDLPAMTTATDTTNSDMSRSLDLTVRIPFVAGAATTSIFALLETLDAFTPDSGQKFNLTVSVDRN